MNELICFSRELVDRKCGKTQMEGIIQLLLLILPERISLIYFLKACKILNWTLFFKKDSRLDLLMNVKYITTELPSEVTNEIKTLINREADIINRGRPAENLSGLRNRIVKLFLSYIQNPDINPEIGLTKTRTISNLEKMKNIQI